MLRMPGVVLLFCLFFCHLPASAQVTSVAVGQIAAEYDAGRYKQAADNAEALISKKPDTKGLADFLVKAGGELSQGKRFGDVARFYQLVSEAYPNHERIESVRAELLACYYYDRQLETALEHVRQNLTWYPDSSWAEYWRFLDAQIQFRLYRFESAQAAFKQYLADYPDGQYAEHAKADLGRIDPVMQVDDNGIVASSSKLAQDARLKQAIADLPTLIDEGHDQLRERLGVDLRPRTHVLYSFIDKGPSVSSGLKATTRVIGVDNQPTTIVYFYTDAVVTNPQSYAVTAVHELKHAGFIGYMGAAYHDLPKWVREGLALWGTDDVDSRLSLVLSNLIAGGKDPLSALDGIEDPDHNYRDYLEDALAFEYLESRQSGNVAVFCKRLIRGEDYREIWSDLTGMAYEEAMDEANAYCQRRVAAALGEAYPSFLKLRAACDLAAKNGAAAARDWIETDGDEELDAWIKANRGHPAEPIARFTLARTRIFAGQHEAGRTLLRTLLDTATSRSTLMDDAQFWIGVSYNFQRNTEDCKKAFGILLRDYPNSPNVVQVRGRFEPAKPVLEQ